MRLPGWIVPTVVVAGACAFLVARLSGSAEPTESIEIVAAQPDAQTPKVLRVAVRAAHRNYGVPFKSISLVSSRTTKRPAILWLAGCGYAMRGKATPKFGAVFMVDEWGEPSGPRDQACQHHNAAELRAAYENDLDFAVATIRTIDWVDHDHILVVGSGEAAPVVAEAFHPAITTKLL